MAWFSSGLKNLESLLEKVDQSAAEKISATTPTRPLKAEGAHDPYDTTYTPSSAIRSAPSASSTSSPSRIESKLRDEDIFSFLNDSKTATPVLPPPQAIVFPTAPAATAHNTSNAHANNSAGGTKTKKVVKKTTAAKASSAGMPKNASAPVLPALASSPPPPRDASPQSTHSRANSEEYTHAKDGAASPSSLPSPPPNRDARAVPALAPADATTHDHAHTHTPSDEVLLGDHNAAADERAQAAASENDTQPSNDDSTHPPPPHIQSPSLTNGPASAAADQTLADNTSSFIQSFDDVNVHNIQHSPPEHPSSRIPAAAAELSEDGPTTSDEHAVTQPHAAALAHADRDHGHQREGEDANRSAGDIAHIGDGQQEQAHEGHVGQDARADASEEADQAPRDSSEHSPDNENKGGDVAEEEEEEEEEEEIDENAARSEAQASAFAELNVQYQHAYAQNAQLTRENMLLRQEVVKLHDDMLTISDKGRATSEALAQATKAMAEHQRASYEREKQIAKLLQSEKDLEAALAAKDMQQAALRTQLEVAQHQVSSRDATLSTLQDTVEVLVRERDAAHAAAQGRVSEAEAAAAQERESNAHALRAAKDAEEKGRTEMAELAAALGMAQRSLEERTLELQRQAAHSKELQGEIKALRQELVDYKLRATKVLQKKEKIIQEMSERATSGAGEEEAEARDGAPSEAALVRQERDRLVQEKIELEGTVDQLRLSLAEQEAQADADLEEMRSQLQSAEDQLKKEKKRAGAMQLEQAARQAEFAQAKDDIQRKVDELQEALSERDVEVQRLKRQLAAKSLSGGTAQELEARLHTMTEHLQQKQAEINTLNSEKAYLTLQLESVVQRNDGAGGHGHVSSLSARGAAKNMDEEEEDYGTEGHGHGSASHSEDVWSVSSKVRQRSIASIMPSSVVTRDSAVGQRVVGAAQFLDRISALTIRTLRRSPWARLGTMFYVLLLHLWVFYIFVSWNPEIHHDDDLGSPGALPSVQAQRQEPPVPS